jgi:hypothetical protein
MNRQLNMTRQDTKALNKMGAALNSPGAHEKFGPALAKCQDRLVCAQLRFLNTVFRYARGKHSFYKRRQVGRRLDDIREAIRRSDAFADRLGDTNRSDLKSFLSERAAPFVEFWQNAIEALDNGLPLEINPKAIPIWFDEMLRDRNWEPTS